MDEELLKKKRTPMLNYFTEFIKSSENSRTNLINSRILLRKHMKKVLTFAILSIFFLLSLSTSEEEAHFTRSKVQTVFEDTEPLIEHEIPDEPSELSPLQQEPSEIIPDEPAFSERDLKIQKRSLELYGNKFLEIFDSKHPPKFQRTRHYTRDKRKVKKRFLNLLAIEEQFDLLEKKYSHLNKLRKLVLNNKKYEKFTKVYEIGPYDEGKKTLMLLALEHSSETQTLLSATYFVTRLLQLYGINKDVTKLLDSFNVYAIFQPYDANDVIKSLELNSIDLYIELHCCNKALVLPQRKECFAEEAENHLKKVGAVTGMKLMQQKKFRRPLPINEIADEHNIKYVFAHEGEQPTRRKNILEVSRITAKSLVEIALAVSEDESSHFTGCEESEDTIEVDDNDVTTEEEHDADDLLSYGVETGENDDDAEEEMEGNLEDEIEEED
eukprot:augustus_masked-scaffold_15-processed-gene-9.52-mRNA-1 protein AED:0.06 eAED:0.06 QI:96/0/0.5/1/0/0.5/2/22/439